MNRRVILALVLLLFAIAVNFPVYAISTNKEKSPYVPNSTFYEDELSNSYYTTASVLLKDVLLIDDAQEQQTLYKEVINLYNEIMKINKNDPLSLFNRAAVYTFSSEYEKAIKDYNRSLA